jgi:hypothetical protein
VLSKAFEMLFEAFEMLFEAFEMLFEAGKVLASSGGPVRPAAALRCCPARRRACSRRAG